MTVIGCAREYRPWALRVALCTDRLVTWGMEPVARRELLAEQVADWDSMAYDASQSSSGKVLFRLMRGLPSALWWRISGSDITALPVAIAIAFVAALSLIAVTATSEYPPDHRLSLFVLGGGLAVAAHRLILRPRSLVAAQFRIASLLVGIGGVATSLTLPTLNDRSYDIAMHSVPAIHYVIKAAILMVSIGFLGVFVASLLKNRRRAVLRAGVLVVGGSVMLAASELAWGILISATDLFLMAMGLLYSFGAAFFVHMVLRLRHLDIN